MPITILTPSTLYKLGMATEITPIELDCVEFWHSIDILVKL